MTKVVGLLLLIGLSLNGAGPLHVNWLVQKKKSPPFIVYGKDWFDA